MMAPIGSSSYSLAPNSSIELLSVSMGSMVGVFVHALFVGGLELVSSLIHLFF